MDKGGSRNGASLSLSLKWLTVEGLKAGLHYWVPWVIKGRLWGWVYLFMGLSLATWSGFVYRGL
jgi:hypothetical protein